MTDVIAHDHASHASFDVSPNSGVVNVRIRGELDLASAGELADVLDEVNPSPGDLVQLDASDVDFIDCSALALLDRARQALAESGVTLWVVSPSLCVRALFDMTDASELIAPGDQTELGDRHAGFRHEPC